MSTIFKVFIAFVTVLLLVYILVYGHKACGIFAPRPGIKLSPPPLEGEVLTTGLPGKSPLCDDFYGNFFKFYFLLTYSWITVCVNYCCTGKWLSYTFIYILFHILFHYGLSQNIEYSSLCSTVGPFWFFLNTSTFFLINVFIYFFIFGCVGPSLLHAGFSSCGAQASQCGGFSCCRARALGAWTSVVVASGLVALWHVGSSRTRARTRVPCIGRRILNHCATREVPCRSFLFIHPVYTPVCIC